VKNWLRLTSLLMLAALACSLSATGSGEADTRPVVSEDRPAVVLLAPQSGERYAQGTTVLLHAQARDLGNGIAKIEFYDNFEAVISTVNASNPQGDPTLTALVEWQPPSAQRHFVRVKAFRADGSESQVQEVSIEVVEAAAPAVQLNAAPVEPVAEEAPAQPEQESEPAAQSQDEPAQEAPSTLQAVVVLDVVNVRVAPDVTAQIAQTPLTGGTTITLVGRSADNLWFATPLASGSVGWVFGDTLTIQGDGAALPLVTR